jgi:hypothetical protein
MELLSKNMKTIYEYITILIIYIYSFIYLNFDKTELSSIVMLFVIQLVFMIYCFVKSNMFSKYNILAHTGICIAGVHITNIFLFVSLILFISLLNKMNTTFKKVKNEPIDLPKKYENIFTLYKKLFISSFTLIFATFVGLTAFFPLINKEFELGFDLNNLIPIFFICCSLASVGMSSYMIYQGNEFLKLSRRQIIN